MGIFRNKNSSPEVQKAVNTAIYPSVFGDTSSAVGNAIDDETGVGYTELVDGASQYGTPPPLRGYAPVTEGDLVLYGDAANMFQLKITNDPPKNTSDAGGDTIDWWDIAQSHFFTVQIYGVNEQGQGTGIHYINGSPIAFASGEGVYNDYIPIKTMNFNYTSYDNMSIPLGIFGDFPLLHRKKVTSISFSCYDTDQDIIEKALHYWEQQCFPGGNYVSYLSDVVADLVYTSYDVCGNMNFRRILQVIPASSVSVSRSYEENAAKMLNFSVVAVGAQLSKGAGGEHSEIPYESVGEGNVYAKLMKIDEWENRQQGRDGSALYDSKYKGIDDSAYGLGLIKGSVNYDVYNSGGVEYGPGQVRARIEQDDIKY